jgi:hypothetical protein
MPFVIKPGKYLIEKTRRHVVGAIALVGTGGSVPKAAQAALDGYIHSLGRSGSDVEAERATIRDAMKGKSGWWLVLSPAGLRWAVGGAGLREEADIKAIKIALKNSGWNPPADKISLLVWGNPPSWPTGWKAP